MSVLKVKITGKGKNEKLTVSYPKNHPKAARIAKWLEYLSPGYVEYLLAYDTDPHCNACRATDCDNVGMGDDACPGFMWGEKW